MVAFGLEGPEYEVTIDAYDPSTRCTSVNEGDAIVVPVHPKEVTTLELFCITELPSAPTM